VGPLLHCAHWSSRAAESQRSKRQIFGRRLSAVRATGARESLAARCTAHCAPQHPRRLSRAASFLLAHEEPNRESSWRPPATRRLCSLTFFIWSPFGPDLRLAVALVSWHLALGKNGALAVQSISIQCVSNFQPHSLTVPVQTRSLRSASNRKLTPPKGKQMSLWKRPQLIDSELKSNLLSTTAACLFAYRRKPSSTRASLAC